MKNFTNNFKQFTSRLSARWLIMALMMLVGTSSAWGWSISANRNVYLYDATTTCNVKLQVWANNSWDNTHNMTKLGNGVYQYKVGNEGYNNYSGFQFIKDCSTKSYVGPFYQDINSVNSCRYSDSWSFPPVWSLTIANNGTNVSKGGSGTKADPYLVPENSTVKVKVSSVGYEQNGLGIRYSWKSTGSATSYTANDTEDSFTIGAAGTVVGVVCDAKTEYSNNLCSVGCASNTIYFKSYTTCAEATLSWASTFDGSMKVGDDVTNPASLDNAAAASSISYTSSNPDVISVNGTTLTALKSGTATITASATKNTGYCDIKSITKEVTVTCDVVNTEDIKIEVVYTGDGIPNIWAWEPNNSNNNLTGGTWPGQAMTPEGNNVYKWETKPTSGQSVSIIISGGNKQTVDIDGLQIGKRYKFKYDPTNGEYDGDKLKKDLLEEDCLDPACTTPNFSVSLPSSGVVNKGDANITASTTGTHSPAVRWSSSNEEVATIDASGNITAHKGGQTTITATTTGDGGFCENVEEPATLTVKENPDVTITADNNPICSGEEATLTANISNLSDGIIPTVSWYKKGENGVKHTGTTYNPTTSGEYYVIVTGDYINEVSLEEEPLQFIINQKPTLQSTLENNNTKVEICGTGEATLSVTPGFASYSWGDGNTKTVNATGKYTVTATDANGCTSDAVQFDVKVLNPTVTLVGDNEQTVCPGANANFEVVLAQGQSVSWKDANGTEVSTSNPFTPEIEGEAGTTYTYKVVVSEGSCSSEESTVSATLKDVQVVTTPIITINPESAMICQGDDATISIVEENQNYTYTIYKDGEALNPQSFTITEAGVYTVGATENECNTSATSMPIELKVVSSDVKIGLEADNTAIGPWQPLKLTVTPAKGYEYTLEGLDDMVYTKEGDVYTIKIPRPNDWSPGNSGTQLELEKEDKVFTAKIKVSDEVSCGSKEVTVTLTDTEENCE